MPETRKIIPFDEAACLAANPFEGDFGSPGDKTLRTQMVTAAKDHPECSCCLGPIFKGERCRVQIEFFDHQLQDYRWCAKCCRAMAVSFDDGGRMWESRERLRLWRRAFTPPSRVDAFIAKNCTV